MKRSLNDARTLRVVPSISFDGRTPLGKASRGAFLPMNREGEKRI